MDEDDVCLGAKNEPKYRCIRCDYATSHLGKWKCHVETKKHKRNQMVQNDAHLESKTSQKKIWRCVCGKEYKYNQGYYRHRKTCKVYHQSRESPAASAPLNTHIIVIIPMMATSM